MSVNPRFIVPAVIGEAPTVLSIDEVDDDFFVEIEGEHFSVDMTMSEENGEKLYRWLHAYYGNG